MKEYQRRTNYESCWPTEEFIIPILKTKIEQLIDKYIVENSTDLYVLDVGCGGQPFRNKIEELGCIYKGFDLKQNESNTIDFVGFIDRELSQEILKHSPFDFIICTEVLEHVANWDKAFINLSNLLSSNGVILITCPHFLQLHEEPYDYWRPTLYAIDYFASKNGLTTIYQEKAGDAWDVLGTLLASCWTFPASSSLGDRITTKLISLIRVAMFNIIKSRIIQKKTRLLGSLYLSNISVLKKIINIS